MPQGVPISACTSDEITGETHRDPPEDDVGKRDDLDSPPQSFCLSKDAEVDWFVENSFYERKLSFKGMSLISKSLILNPTANNSSSSSMKPKASLIMGLPNMQKHGTGYPKSRRRCKLTRNTHLFLKHTDSSRTSGGRSPPPAEPSSPKVSCMGTVTSKDCSKKTRDSHSESERRGKSGLLPGCRDVRATAVHVPTAELHVSRRPTEPSAGTMREPISTFSAMRSIGAGKRPDLAGMVRFTACRRSSESWEQS
ncbi:hypothetical protein SAY86_024231 [Trapa natans]|uniref:Uncharacterized protein n=1 Tax=Trapa natans TaxID=22666 RepID=A0AAN7M4C7_TRANT|nr:hypothetical protein SAY86_024231 [Trapa natans]